MEMQKAVHRVFHQLTDSLEQIDTDQYRFRCDRLSGNSIGQHVRHIIEMFQCLETGYISGEVDYEQRKRDRQIETDKEAAIALLREIDGQIRKENKSLLLITCYPDALFNREKIDTNYYREIVYNLEHTVHHMALIRVGLREISTITLDDSYGVADSTLKYRKQCAQ